MKELINELMNHGYSMDQAKRFIRKFIKLLTLDCGFCIHAYEKRKEFDLNYAASDNETEVKFAK